MKLFGYELNVSNVTDAVKSAASYVPAPVKTAAAYVGGSAAATATFAFGVIGYNLGFSGVQYGAVAKFAAVTSPLVAGAAFGAKYAYDNGYFGSARNYVASVDYSRATSAASTAGHAVVDNAKYGVGLAGSLLTSMYNRVRGGQAAPAPRRSAVDAANMSDTLGSVADEEGRRRSNRLAAKKNR